MPIARRDYERTSERDSVCSKIDSPPQTKPSDSYDSLFNPQEAMRDVTSDGWTAGSYPLGDRRNETRSELIERLKKKSPWIQTSVQTHTTVPPTEIQSGGPNAAYISPPSLLPAAEIVGRSRSPSKTRDPTPYEDPSSIERPRSALHSGDFRQESPQRRIPHTLVETPHAPPSRPDSAWISTSPTTPWFMPSLLPGPSPAPLDISSSNFRGSEPITVQSRSRADSYSSSSSFVFRPPTSPLAQQSNSTDFDFLDDRNSRHRSGSPEKFPRRHTFTPHSFQTFRRSPLDQASSTGAGRPLPNLRREGSFPYQAHQPRRSITSLQSSHSYSTPQSPYLQARRPSVSSEYSPLQRAPLVGPYEESILRGRMSTLPSRPLDFVAQIGVLGKGNCKPSLICPPHLTVPFPAVFYSYGDSKPKTSATEDGPSPYVGLIDLENFSKPVESSENSNGDNITRSPTSPNIDSRGDDSADADSLVSPLDRWMRKRKDRGSPTSRKAPKGSYRIPQIGQLQIVIKNPNKTAVKLFLVPYDLSGMAAGQKTFIRQRSYSAGPIIDMPLSSRTNLGTDRPEAALSMSDNPEDRPVLRYLIHLNICSPSEGRFYLHRSIRVVFANRVPDSKEKLRNEIQLPEPRYSAYRPEQRHSRGPSDW